MPSSYLLLAFIYLLCINAQPVLEQQIQQQKVIEALEQKEILKNITAKEQINESKNASSSKQNATTKPQEIEENSDKKDEEAKIESKISVTKETIAKPESTKQKIVKVQKEKTYAWVSMIDHNITSVIGARVLSQSLSKLIIPIQASLHSVPYTSHNKK